MKKLTIALSLALPLLLTGAAAIAQTGTAGGDVSVAASNRVIIKIKASSPEQAMAFARLVLNFKVDESFGAQDQGNGTYFVRGEETGPLSDAGAAGHVLDVFGDVLSRPN